MPENAVISREVKKLVLRSMEAAWKGTALFAHQYEHLTRELPFPYRPDDYFQSCALTMRRRSCIVGYPHKPIEKCKTYFEEEIFLHAEGKRLRFCIIIDASARHRGSLILIFGSNGIAYDNARYGFFPSDEYSIGSERIAYYEHHDHPIKARFAQELDRSQSGALQELSFQLTKELRCKARKKALKGELQRAFLAMNDKNMEEVKISADHNTGLLAINVRPFPPKASNPRSRPRP